MSKRNENIKAIEARMAELNARLGRVKEYARYLDYLKAYELLERELYAAKQA